jgi:hypothetical protein
VLCRPRYSARGAGVNKNFAVLLDYFGCDGMTHILEILFQKRGFRRTIYCGPLLDPPPICSLSPESGAGPLLSGSQVFES